MSHANTNEGKLVQVYEFQTMQISDQGKLTDEEGIT